MGASKSFPLTFQHHKFFIIYNSPDTLVCTQPAINQHTMSLSQYLASVPLVAGLLAGVVSGSPIQTTTGIILPTMVTVAKGVPVWDTKIAISVLSVKAESTSALEDELSILPIVTAKPTPAAGARRPDDEMFILPIVPTRHTSGGGDEMSILPIETARPTNSALNSATTVSVASTATTELPTGPTEDFMTIEPITTDEWLSPDDPIATATATVTTTVTVTLW